MPADLFDKVLESLPEDAHRRRAWLALLRCFSRIERVLKSLQRMIVASSR